MLEDARKRGEEKWWNGIIKSTENKAICEVRTRMTRMTTQGMELEMEQRFSSSFPLLFAQSNSSPVLHSSPLPQELPFDRPVSTIPT